jgi:ribonucleoside-triphosphate reductase
MQVIKKDGTLEAYNEQKIINACNKAAMRAMVKLSSDDYSAICSAVWDKLVENNLEDTEIYEMHNIVESVLEELQPKVAKMYKEYRNYKKDFIHMMDKVYSESQSIRYIGDKSNANTDSALVATKRSLIYNSLSGELYKKFFLTLDEKQAMKDGYIYIHDRSARLDTMNCCLSRVGTIMKGGFEMGNVWYNEPNSLDTAFDVMGDIILSTAAQQYGFPNLAVVKLA